MTTPVAIVIAILAVSLLIIIHEAGHMMVARFFGMRVERFSVGFGPVLLRFTVGETEYAISALPFGGYVKIAGMSATEDVAEGDKTAFANQPAWRRFAVILAGSGMNYLTGVLIAAGLVASVGLLVPDSSPKIGVVSGKPALEAGLVTGDQILSVNGVATPDWNTLLTELRGNPGKSIPIEVERESAGKVERLRLVIKPDDVDGVGRIGVGQHETRIHRSIPAALMEGFSRSNAQIGVQLSAFGQLFGGKQKAELSGPIGIAQHLVRGAQAGLERFMSLVWVITLVLAVLNLMPFPALDGGRLIFLGYEIVTRRRVNARVENMLHLVGFIFLISVLLWVTIFSDLARLRGK